MRLSRASGGCRCLGSLRTQHWLIRRHTLGGLPIGFERAFIQLWFCCQCQKSKVRHLSKNERFIIRAQSGSQMAWTEPGLGFRPSGARHLYPFPLPFPSPPLPRVWVKLSSCCCPFIKSHGPSALPSSPGKRLTVSCRSHVHNSRVECSLIRLYSIDVR